MNKRLYPLLEAEGVIGAESTSVESAEIAAAQTQEAPNETTEDVTKQESFAKRLKESTEKAIAEERTKWEQETVSKAQQARDALIAENGYKWNGKDIKTEAEYKQALKEQELTEQYKAKDLPDDVIQELVEGKKFRDEYQTKEQETQRKAKVESDFQDFVSTFPEAKPEDIPQSVWDEVGKGRSLVDAYSRYENQSLKTKLAEFQKIQQIEQKNRENAALSTGSLNGKGEGTQTSFFTHAQVKAMSREEVARNYNAIMESQKKW